MTVGAVRSIELGVTDLERSTAFYSGPWALRPVGDWGGARYFRAAGPDAYVLALRQTPEPRFIGVEFAVAGRAEVDALAGRLSAVDGMTVEPPAELQRPGAGYGASARDRFGRSWRISAGVVADTATATPDRPSKISHVVLNSHDRDADVALARDVLGFRVRDVTNGQTFLGCNADHHSLAITGIADAGLNHVAYEVESIDAVMRAVGRMKRHGFPLEWGIGRHGPGANVFSYYLDPDEFPIEFTTDIQQIDDAVYRPGTPSDWNRPPFWDAWGQAEPPTERFRAASSGKRGVSL